MNKSRGHILWIDDEIDHLKPHRMFLEEKGFQVLPATNGPDGVELIKTNPVDLVLLDQFMPGMDGMDTLREIKNVRPTLPVIMITKSEEEWLMDEAIYEKVAQFLIKPVNPTQILMACKQVLEQSGIRAEKATSGFLQVFQDLESQIRGADSADDWWLIYTELVKWQLEFDEHPDSGLGEILSEQSQTANREFLPWFIEHYSTWVTERNGPPLSVDIIPRFVEPLLEQKTPVCLLVIDSLRYDHFRAIQAELGSLFELTVDYQCSLLPSATPFSRNAIFSGLFPDEFTRKYAEQARAFREHAPSLNRLEDQFLTDLLKRHGRETTSTHYHKIWKAEEGQRFAGRLSEYLNVDLLALVVNFVDILAHKRAESDVLMEMVPDESGYRKTVRTWYQNSWLSKTLKQLAERGFTVVLTSDHGSLRVQRGTVVGADRETSSGIRYKYGRNLNCKDRSALVIRKPAEYGLPEFGPQTTYLIAKDDIYFLYPTQYHRYHNLYKDSFQHGGISLEELLVPVVTMRPR
ncbi:MAG: bifunctional response regulator/alkaline phosphatase family protein [FCB group bacterium]|nr:bifunctional response regulator/alkaline phosphatase family protein [FCB group bacterium]